MAVEIKQVLERDFEIDITAPELRSLTFGKLQELTDAIGKDAKLSKPQKPDITHKTLFRALGDEKMANEILIPLNVITTDQPSDTVALFILGMEGVLSPVLHTLCKSIGVPVYM